MAAYEIHLNRRAINSIELPAQVQADAGKTLVLSFNNHGHPLHVSLSAVNAARFTPFVHENLFVQGQTEFEIPMYEDAKEGTFSLEVVTGYGRTSCEMKVLVRRPLPEKVEKKEEKEPERIQVPWARMAPVVAGLLLYAASFQPGLGILKDLAFFALLAGLIVLWLRQG
ncbi:MAG: hypothetical protein LUQ32_02555 [Methanomicrobiales archaeon]|nr:hypothetical protein [Methanomicrobiales archaeon]